MTKEGAGLTICPGAMDRDAYDPIAILDELLFTCVFLKIYFY